MDKFCEKENLKITEGKTRFKKIIFLIEQFYKNVQRLMTNVANKFSLFFKTF